MDDTRSRQFFLQPRATFHRQYEALRAFFVDRQPLEHIARQFGFQCASLRSLISRFRGQLEAGEVPPFLPHRARGPSPSAAIPKQRRERKRRRSPIAAP
jgi:hypothetical protein